MVLTINVMLIIILILNIIVVLILINYLFGNVSVSGIGT